MGRVINNIDFDGPGLHALIIGVSDYAFLPEEGDEAIGFGMPKLASPALSAFRVYQWLSNPGPRCRLAMPVKSCRVLLAPHEKEELADPLLPAFVDQHTILRPTWDNVQAAASDWRDDAKTRKDDATFFYFAGHGMRLSGEDGLMLLDDFAKEGVPEENFCVSVARLRQAMAPFKGQTDIARTQFYFIDACRDLQQDVLEFDIPGVRDILRVVKKVTEKGLANPTYFATTNGDMAISRSGKETVFCEALLHAVTHAAESLLDEGWGVTADTLKRGLRRFLLRKHKGEAPEIAPGGIMGDELLTLLDSPPEVEIDFEVSPANLAQQAGAKLALIDSDGLLPPGTLPEAALTNFRLTVPVPVGVYRIKVSAPTLPAQGYISRSTVLNQALKLPHVVRTNPGAAIALGDPP